MAKHIEIQEDLLPLIGKKDNVLDGVTGFVEHYDFSKANTSYEARVQAITTVASICYQSPKALGSVSLFDRLQAESAGLPSSSYEFIPVLLTNTQAMLIGLGNKENVSNHVLKYGESIDDDYILTNLRALIEDVGAEESLNYLNTSEEEIQIIRDNFKVFLFNVNLACRAQMVRHRINWQELSRRYVSGKKREFSFYTRSKFNDMVFTAVGTPLEDEMNFSFKVSDYLSLAESMYFQALEQGARPEEARDLLPQAMMTQIWGAFQPKQLEGFFKLRLDDHAQKEIRQTAESMKELIND